MKKMLFILAIILSGNAYSSNITKTIPSPFWYSISEKIIAETQHLLSLEAKDKVGKVKIIKTAKTVKNTLKCQPKKEIILPAPYFTITASGLWIINE